MSSNIEVDRISFLPKNIVDSILSRLEIKEAVRTSILSRSWRYQWHSLLIIEINWGSFPFWSDQMQVLNPEFNEKMVKIIDHIFSVHRGSVEKFKLDVNLEVKSAGSFSSPSLKINAPNLVMLHIEGFHCYSQFFNKFPLLTSVTFSLEESHDYLPTAADQDCRIVELLGSMPVLRRLEFDGYAFQNVVGGNIPVHLPFICPIVYLSASINFEDLQELLIAFCIFRSSPFISRLEIWCCSDKSTSVVPADGFLNMEHDFGFKFDNLKIAYAYSFNGIETEIMFFEYLLANAPVLEEMNIICIGDSDSEEIQAMVSKLIQFPRASPKAEIFYGMTNPY